MTPPKAAKGWVVVSPFKDELTYTKARTAKTSRKRAEKRLNADWYFLKSFFGYECKPCTITVSEDER